MQRDFKLGVELTGPRTPGWGGGVCLLAMALGGGMWREAGCRTRAAGPCHRAPPPPRYSLTRPKGPLVPGGPLETLPPEVPISVRVG